jgi:hypothetical protein
MAEIAIAILERLALSRRLEDEVALRHQVLAVETERDARRCGIAWQYTSRDRRRTPERLYPVKACPLDSSLIQAVVDLVGSMRVGRQQISEARCFPGTRSFQQQHVL